jgi:hypothetical protein
MLNLCFFRRENFGKVAKMSKNKVHRRIGLTTGFKMVHFAFDFDKILLEFAR